MKNLFKILVMSSINFLFCSEIVTLSDGQKIIINHDKTWDYLNKEETFKNISNEKKAWMLIKEAGCENFREGDASISEKHCNFFVNNGNAKSADIENLIKKVKKKVYEKTGINLELEIKITGE